MHRYKRIFSLSPTQHQPQGHRHSDQPQGSYLFFVSRGTNWMWGLTHAVQQMSGSLRLGQLISMTNRAPQSTTHTKPPPLHAAGGPALSGWVEAMGHRWCWFLWRATVVDCQNALGLVEREGCRLVQPFSSWTHTDLATEMHVKSYSSTLTYPPLLYNNMRISF